ncbi:NADPH:quinone oxidoreductase family protein [Paludibacillus litoralis]|uniref:NADPH:quinone oxidoreductase family protein n=1 Tax=Paludibacillus litoralis TaxID=3133267 RepID=UPI0039B77772
MRALICAAFGPYASHEVKDVPAPAMKPGHVRIAVKAAGMNFPDILIVEGKYQIKPEFPFSPGAECAGVVTEVGEGVEGFSIGDRVFYGSGYGGFAEEVVAPAEKVFHIPDNMSFEQGSAINLVYGTSYHALKDRARLKPGETLFVLGAAGGVGLAAVELGKAMGATVIAGASSEEKLEVAKAHGADMCVNYAKEDIKTKVRELSDGGVDVVYDPVGDKLAEPAFRALGWEGRYLVVGFAGGEIPRLPLNLALLKSADIRGVFWGQWVARNPEKHRQNVAEYLQLFSEGKIRPRISASYPLEDFVKGYDDLAKRRAMGKVVLTMGG